MDGIFTGSKPENKKSVEWYTPKWIFDNLGVEFDLDPASPYDHETAVPADTKLTKFDDGLACIWYGTVWLNPPYGRDTHKWIQKMADHGTGIALVFSRTDSKWCQLAMRSCTAMLFMSGRIQFEPGHENKHKKSRCGAGTVMFAFGEYCSIALENLSDRGTYIRNGAPNV